MPEESIGRRRLLVGAGALLVAGVAGCVSDDDDDAQENGAPGEENDADGVDSEQANGENGDETDFPEGSDGFEVSGDFELPVDPEPLDFYDGTGQDVVEVETIRRADNTPEFVFDPPFVRVDEGTTIRWVNADGVFHTVTSTENLDTRSPSGTFDAQIASEGATFDWEATELGRQNYYCAPHVGFMFGAIEVT